MENILNAFVLLANFVIIPGAAYGSQLALGALGVTLIYAILRFSGKRIKWLILPLHESETDRHLIGLSG
ncbi:hypothetical protein [Azoarcus taiwanensis]|uniref:hypothetical protein n=1 Tax=Azoarcus taiwanensis TaxID=666964 RepID=UPI0014599958|nr:hypothetical protein [Azoarcus taiwanensis]